MRRPGPHFGDHPRVRSGVFYFLFLVSLLQLAFWGIPRIYKRQLQKSLVRTDTLKQAVMDRLESRIPKDGTWTLRPLDPNGLEDYRGYLLGIPHESLDRLYAFRNGGGVLYNLEQFGQISGLPDSSLQRLRPFLRFPAQGTTDQQKPRYRNSGGKDLNLASAPELQSVSGIGPVLSGRIVRFRDALGGFLSASQLYDVYGLEPEVARRVMAAFPLKTIPAVERISLNEATVEELASLLYLTREMAVAIVARRDSLGPFKSLRELRLIKRIPETKIERIALYLEL